MQQERNPTSVSQMMAQIRELLPRCDSGLPRDSLNGTGITGNVFERPPAQEGLSSTTLNNSKNSASSSQGNSKEREK